MQAEMIAVQVLSQSATGDVQFFQQQQPNTQIVPVSTIAGVDIQSSLNQVTRVISILVMSTIGVTGQLGGHPHHNLCNM